MTIKKIPLEIFMTDGTGCHLFVEVEINQQNGFLILDTGASQTVLSKNDEIIKTAIKPLNQEEYMEKVKTKGLAEHFSNEELEEMGIENEGVLSLAANGTPIDFDFGIIEGVKLNNKITLEPFAVALMDLTNISLLYKKMKKNNIWGLLGSDLLLKYNAVIDYKNELLTLEI